MADETPPRLIGNTTEPTRHPWPQDCYVQGGALGVVFRGAAPYRTAFVEAFPRNPNTFIRGEGPTIEVAEGACWRKFQTWRDCDGTGSPHGPFEPRQYSNGAGYCTRCGTWFTGVCEPAQEPVDPDAPKPLIERLFGDHDETALAEVFDVMARAGELPEAHRE